MRPLLLALCLWATAAQGGEPWDRTDKLLGAAAATMWAIDWGQTRYIAQNPDKYRELNIFLGEHPSVSRVNNYFIGMGIAGYLIADHLSSKNRKIFLGVVTAIEIGVTAHNRHIGVKIAF